MAKRFTKADHERIRAEVEQDSRNRALPEIPEAEKVKKHFNCGHEVLMHPDYEPTPRQICKECAAKPATSSPEMWSKMPPRNG
jgi:hypothetical protein